MHSRLHKTASNVRILAIICLLWLVHLNILPSAHAQITCNGHELMPTDQHHDQNLEVTGPCTVKKPGLYAYKNVNIVAEWDSDGNPTSKGVLHFEPESGAKIDFWAESILVENEGSLIAGTKMNPIGMSGERLTFHLYGADQGAKPFTPTPSGDGGVGIICKTETNDVVDECGIPHDRWNGNDEMPVSLPGNVTDFFYKYTPLPYDDGIDTDTGKQGYFGYKVLAVSYGGTLQLFGAKGATFNDTGETGKITEPWNSQTSWARLNQTIQPTDKMLVLDRDVDWQESDRIVVTTTDYVPGHSEQLEITNVVNAKTFEFVRVDPKTQMATTEGALYNHNGEVYPLTDEAHPGISGLNLDIKVDGQPAVETRAAVALLTRSIRIVSEGENFNEPLPGPDQCENTENVGENKHPCYFGGHTVVRQGVKKFQVQGVEFYQLGQGGRIGHYPIHFHQARIVPNLDTTNKEDVTFVKDSSVHDSMTRCYTVHATQKAILARNVGYKSIGHCYYLEDGVETDNKLYSNIGILARAAVQDGPGETGAPQKQNPRRIPGILASPDLARNGFPQASDSISPAVFWFTNSWNEFIGNMAVGATGCGAAYWPVAALVSGPSIGKKWKGYATISTKPNGDSTGATAPLKIFDRNYASSTEWSFPSVGNLAACNGISVGGSVLLHPVPNPLVPAPQIPAVSEKYYPRSDGGFPNPTHCPVNEMTGEPDCSGVEVCAGTKPGLDNCAPTILNHYTSSFHWAEGTFAAIWLRHAFFVLMNSAVTDVQGGGVSFVTGGSYTASDVPPGGFMLGAKSVFIGHAQAQHGVCSDDTTRTCLSKLDCGGMDATCVDFNPFAFDGGPANPGTKDLDFECAQPNNYCLVKDEGLVIPTGTNWMNFQRLVNIYDGPFFQESNAYLDINRTPITDCAPASGQCSVRLNQCTTAADCTGICSTNTSQDCMTNNDCPDNGTCQPQTCKQPTSNTCPGSEFMWGRAAALGVRYDPTQAEPNRCLLPNAAIAWKQSNGFYYPPAFNSKDLYFNNVDIRHYVVEPLFLPEKTGARPFRTDVAATRANYCTFNENSWQNFTAIDRQTVLNDDDGSLTGLFVGPEDDPQATISVNQDSFFNAPVETFQCRSDNLFDKDGKIIEGTAKTSPYEYVTTAVYPACALTPENCDGDPTSRLPKCECTTDRVWGQACSNEECFGIPLYRQYLTGTENENPPDPRGEFRKIRMMGPAVFSRLNLTANNGLYYIDTTPGRDVQPEFPNNNLFQKNQKYYVFLLFARPSTKQTYQIYVGESKFDKTRDLTAELANISQAQVDFQLIDWPQGWTRCYGTKDEDIECQNTNSRRKPGILEVTVDLSGERFRQAFEAAPEENCSPGTLCEFNNATSTCECKQDSEFSEECEQANICSWSGSAIDCPVVNGEPRCPGFAVKLASSFKTTDDDPALDPRPEPLCFPDTPGVWDVMFSRNETTSGVCRDTPEGMTNFCGMGAFPNALGGVGGGGAPPQGGAPDGSTPQETIGELLNDVELLVQEGELRPKHAKSPEKKLEKALKKLGKGKEKATCRQLRKFVKKVERRMKKDKLADAEGAELVEQADMIRQSLSCGA